MNSVTGGGSFLRREPHPHTHHRYFVGSAAVSVSHVLGIEHGILASPRLARLLWVIFEMGLSYSMLVTVIVTYALIPMTKKRAPKVRGRATPAKTPAHPPLPETRSHRPPPTEPSRVYDPPAAADAQRECAADVHGADSQPAQSGAHSPAHGFGMGGVVCCFCLVLALQDGRFFLPLYGGW